MKKFVGQKEIVDELYLIYKDIQQGINYNILFSAESGYGKSLLAGIFSYRIGLETTIFYDSSELFEINTEKTLHILDEVHLLQFPEIIYPFMDSGNYTFLLLTNNVGLCKEPLINRCIVFQFKPYSKEEKIEIAKNILNLSEELLEKIVIRCRTPRDIRNICLRLGYVFRNYFIPNTPEELDTILTKTLGIDERGFTQQHYNYLNSLKTCGGNASLFTLMYLTKNDRATITRDIEPILLDQGYIQITAKGRKLMKEILC